MEKNTNNIDLRMCMGLELVSLKEFNEFSVDYKKLSYMSGHVYDDAIKLNVINMIPSPISNAWN